MTDCMFYSSLIAIADRGDFQVRAFLAFFNEEALASERLATAENRLSLS